MDKERERERERERESVRVCACVCVCVCVCTVREEKLRQTTWFSAYWLFCAYVISVFVVTFHFLRVSIPSLQESVRILNSWKIINHLIKVTRNSQVTNINWFKTIVYLRIFFILRISNRHTQACYGIFYCPMYKQINKYLFKLWM